MPFCNWKPPVADARAALAVTLAPELALSEALGPAGVPPPPCAPGLFTGELIGATLAVLPVGVAEAATVTVTMDSVKVTVALLGELVGLVGLEKPPLERPGEGLEELHRGR